MNNLTTIYSIGHSNHEWEHFLKLLLQHEIGAVADVRSSPYSKFNPQYNQKVLQQRLHSNNIAYVDLGKELGARRTEPECYSRNRVDYDLVAKSQLFQEGISRLLAGSYKMRIAMMCAEKDPLTCHRTILVARHLQQHVGNVIHILESGDLEEHAAAESRLMKECKLHEVNMFDSEQERIQRAYSQREEQIAYTEQIETEQ